MESIEETTERPEHDTVSARDRGATFIEVLISIVLLGTAGIAVIAAMAAAAGGAGVHRNVSDTQAWLATTGDAISEVPPEASDNYVDCASNTNAQIVTAYQTVVNAVRATNAPTVTVQSVEYWNSTSGSEGYGTTCRYAQGDRLQQVTLSVTVDGVSETLAVVKRPALSPTVSTMPPPTTLGNGQVVPPETPGL